MNLALQTEPKPLVLPRIWPLKGPYDQVEFRRHLGLMEDRKKPDILRVQAEIDRCAKFPTFWVMTYCFTKDEHDASRPVKRFPRYKYIPYILKELKANPRIIIPKSRQVMITWTVLSYLLWRACFNRHRLIFVQSKKEEDAAALIDRCKHMYEYLPWWQHEVSPLKRPLAKQPFNKLSFANGSVIWGVPQGADVLRQYTASIIFGDEFAFQDKAEEAYNASKPTIDGGGQFIIVSSANGRNFFYRMVYDKMDASISELAA